MAESNHSNSSKGKRNILPIAIAALAALIIFGVAYLLSISFLGAAWFVISTLLVAAIAGIAILAGFLVLKSLFLIAAELSLLIFIAQSYCAASPALRSSASDDALRSLVLLGAIYIAFAFVQELYAALRERFARIGQSTRVSGVPGWNSRKIVVTSVFFIFAGLFLVEIFLVIKPIVLGLCVFR